MQKQRVALTFEICSELVDKESVASAPKHNFKVVSKPVEKLRAKDIKKQIVRVVSHKHANEIMNVDDKKNG